MSTNFVQCGDRIDDFTRGSAVAAGEVIPVGNVLGVALTSAAANAFSTVALEGVFRVPKVAGSAITRGSRLVYKAASKSFAVSSAATVTGDITGDSVFAWADAASGDTSMLVKFTGTPGTVV